MDDADRAQPYQENVVADALRDLRRRQQIGTGRSHCEECEEPIPEARRRAHPAATRCLSCQADFETNSRRDM